MVFQVQLPSEMEIEPEQINELSTETQLFGENQYMNETFLMFQKVIYELLDFKIINNELIYNTNFDSETIKHTILTKLDRGCLGPSPNIVILEPGANPNSDEEILNVTKMYKKDFILKIGSFLDIVGDEALFRRLIKCREIWSNIRPILGQWHTSKDLCSVLIVLFSSYELLSLASQLGVRFLDKFESAVDYRATARVLDLLWVAVGLAINIFITKKKIQFSEIMNSNSICLKIWYHYYKWAGIWKAHRMGMRVGNFKLQKNSLSAAGPLYASAGKFNYTTAIAHFLASIAKYPEFEKKLNYCGAFKIPQNINNNSENLHHICFGFDEALETFGVKYIKQNINGTIINEKNLRDQIKSSQEERERIDLLMSEYLDDNSMSHSKRAIKSRKESLWELVNNLVTVFEMENPLTHPLFQNYTPTQMHQEGLEKLISCYPNGLERIKKIYRQEVLKIESKNTQGRRATEVVKTKLKDYNNNKKRVKKSTITNPTESIQTEQNQINELTDTAEPPTKKRKVTSTKHRTTENEITILSTLKSYKNKLPDNAIASVREQLSEVWTIKKVREWWNYHKNK
ncbi:hypothetical protein Glove_615g48 [Diversispora epigaea]|uniref:Uncharacterized protein n=1 Tax=Diversispora epigaea TaxID=1348612 RepID=A0A397G681_9GLOM|nr:hypothetical protein Glove_615g48 [Diversispora epigaea]